MRDVVSAVDRLYAIADALGVPCEGVLVEAMVPFTFEFLLGLRRDASFGPLIAIGRGGVEVEVTKDVGIALLPAGPQEIERLIRSLRSLPLLQGFRGREPLDIEAVGRVLSRLADGFVADEDILEIEINPLVVTAQGVVALDALVTRRAQPLTGTARAPE
jgi:acyl-CoA synthetase (NDP forming)